MSRHCGTAEDPNTSNMWSGIVMLKRSSVEFHGWNDELLQDLILKSDAHQWTTLMDSCPQHHPATTKPLCQHQMFDFEETHLAVSTLSGSDHSVMT